LLFSGANVDINSLPVFMRAISYALPLTRGILSARLLIAGKSLSEAMPLILGELGIGLIYGVLGYFLFMWFEVVAKRRGTLDLV
jgi:uncharacterized phage infection (PIP) family protein YhgE